jgi:hypothetical protein
VTTRGAAVALLAVVALLTSGCTGGSGGTPTPDPSAADASRRTACRAAVVELVDTTQRYVNGYADVSLRTDGSQPTSTPSPDPHAVTDDDLQAAVTRTVRTRDQQRCDPPSFSSQLDQGLSALTAQGPVAAAVMRQLRADFTGKVATDAATVPVAAGTDLATAVAEAASGSTLELAAGTFRLSETLVLLRGVTLRGAGVGTTTLVSTAADASVLVLTADRVDVEDLTVRHGGRSDASVLVGGSTASLQVRRTRLTGARLGDGGGGAGLLMTAAEKAPPATGTTLEVTDVVVDGNEGAGITLTGTHRASIVGAEVRDNGQCGVCFLGATSGAVRQSTFTGNAAAVAATGRATPQVRDNRIEGGQVGVQATGHAAPVLTANTIVGAARAAVIYQGHAAGRADRTRCRDVKYGLVVGPDALPFLGRNGCTVVRSR